jgi:hypothetical protein
METLRQSNPYTPAQAATVTGLPLPAVQKAIEYRLIRPKVVREGRSLYRLLSKSQVLYLNWKPTGSDVCLWRHGGKSREPSRRRPISTAFRFRGAAPWW